MSSEIMPGKFFYFSIASLLVVPILTWKRLFQTYRRLINEYNSDFLFFKRHNCVVMYSKTRGMTGWPPYEELKLNIDQVNKFVEPYLYFIETAKTNLDIAVMMLDMKIAVDALIQARKRGVKIRVILNFASIKSRKDLIHKMHKSGIEVALHVAKELGLDTIMHHKYMVKDWHNSGGYVCMGSANLTSQTSFLNNFEDVIFSSRRQLVEMFQENFEQCWEFICRDNEGPFKRALLEQANFLLQ